MGHPKRKKSDHSESDGDDEQEHGSKEQQESSMDKTADEDSNKVASRPIKISLKLPMKKEDDEKKGNIKIHLKRVSSDVMEKTPFKSSIPKVIMDMHEIMKKLIVFLLSKDQYGFFSAPVNPNFVPDYLKVIKVPIDLGTMQKKVEQKEYKTLQEFQKDFELIISNAKTYNAPETVYYKSAEKLASFGLKAIGKEITRFEKEESEPDVIKQVQENESSKTHGDDEVNVIIDEEAIDAEPPNKHEIETVSNSDNAIESDKKTKLASTADMSFSDSSRSSTPIPESLRDKPKSYKKKTALLMKSASGGYLFSSAQQKHLGYGPDASCLYNANMREIILLPTPSLPSHRIPKLGTLSVLRGQSFSKGNLDDSLKGKDDMAVPVLYTDYGPYSTFSPKFDSSKATISPGESAFLWLTYADPLSYAYVKSLQHFVAPTGSRLNNHVNNILSSITKGVHDLVNYVENPSQIADSNSMQIQKNGIEIVEESNVLMNEAPNIEESIETTIALSKKPQLDSEMASNEMLRLIKEINEELEKNGIAQMSFTKEEIKDFTASSSDMESLLKENKKLMLLLQKKQEERLLRMSFLPDEAERNLATKLQFNLKRMVDLTGPGSLASKDSLRSMMDHLEPCQPVFRGTLPPLPIKPTMQQQSHPSATFTEATNRSAGFMQYQTTKGVTPKQFIPASSPSPKSMVSQAVINQLQQQLLQRKPTTGSSSN